MVKVMLKSGLVLLAALSMPMTAFANGATPFPGDEDFLVDTDRAVENGADFSYARLWGERRAYDGTATSRAVPLIVKPALVPEPSPPSRSNYITRPPQPASPNKAVRPKLRGRLSD